MVLDFVILFVAISLRRHRSVFAVGKQMANGLEIGLHKFGVVLPLVKVVFQAIGQWKPVNVVFSDLEKDLKSTEVRQGVHNQETRNWVEESSLDMTILILIGHWLDVGGWCGILVIWWGSECWLAQEEACSAAFRFGDHVVNKLCDTWRCCISVPLNSEAEFSYKIQIDVVNAFSRDFKWSPDGYMTAEVKKTFNTISVYPMKLLCWSISLGQLWMPLRPAIGECPGEATDKIFLCETSVVIWRSCNERDLSKP